MRKENLTGLCFEIKEKLVSAPQYRQINAVLHAVVPYVLNENMDETMTASEVKTWISSPEKNLQGGTIVLVKGQIESHEKDKYGKEMVEVRCVLIENGQEIAECRTLWVIHPVTYFDKKGRKPL